MIVRAAVPARAPLGCEQERLDAPDALAADGLEDSEPM
jgi:hypothetical protein